MGNSELYEEPDVENQEYPEAEKHADTEVEKPQTTK